VTAADRIRDYLDALEVNLGNSHDMTIQWVPIGAVNYELTASDLRAVLAELDEARKKLARVEEIAGMYSKYSRVGMAIRETLGGH
jgi:hypothetical protein